MLLAQVAFRRCTAVWRPCCFSFASVSRLGDYPEARFNAPGGVYGPDGGRLARSTGAMSVGEVDFGSLRAGASLGSPLLETPGMSTPHTVAGLICP